MDNQVDHQGFLFPSSNYYPSFDHDTAFFQSFPPPMMPPSSTYDHGNTSGLLNHHQFGLSSALNYMGGSSSSAYGSLHAEVINKMTAQEMMDAKALAASKSHSEAERRRRERINAHLTRLRSLLPNTTKTDKASLLAEVIQHVKELKRQTSEMGEAHDNLLPTESDEVTVIDATNNDDDSSSRFTVKASLCCDDRPDLIPDLVRALKALKLRTLKAEITTLGGRVKNILLISGEGVESHQQLSISSIQDALKAVMERSGAHEASSSSAVAGGIKRQRTGSLSSLMQQRAI